MLTVSPRSKGQPIAPKAKGKGKLTAIAPEASQGLAEISPLETGDVDDGLTEAPPPKAKGKGKPQAVASPAAPGHASVPQPQTGDADNSFAEDALLRPSAPPSGQPRPLRPSEPTKLLEPRAKAKSVPAKAPAPLAPQAASSRGARVGVQGLPKAWVWYGEVDHDKISALLGKFGELDLSGDRQPSITIQRDGHIAVTATFREEECGIAAFRTLQGGDAWLLNELLDGSGGLQNEEIYVSAQMLPLEPAEAAAVPAAPGRKIRPIRPLVSQPPLDQEDHQDGETTPRSTPPAPKAHMPQLKTLDNAWASFEKRFIPKQAQSAAEVETSSAQEDERNNLSEPSQTQESMGKKGKGKSAELRPTASQAAAEAENDAGFANSKEAETGKGSKAKGGKIGKASEEAAGEERWHGNTKGAAKDGDSYPSSKGIKKGKGSKISEREVDDEGEEESVVHESEAALPSKSKGKKSEEFPHIKGKGKQQSENAKDNISESKEYEPPLKGKGEKRPPDASGKDGTAEKGKKSSKGGKSLPLPRDQKQIDISRYFYIRILSCPGSWGSKEVREACSQFGTVESVADGSPTPGQFTVAFMEAGAAESAVLGLAFRQVGSKDAPFAIECELLPSENGSEELAVGRKTEYVNGQIFGDFAGMGSPIVVHLDELYLLPSEHVDQSSREVFLRGVPVADYSPSELREWLEAYGKIKDFTLLQDPIMAAFSGTAYIRFEGHSSGKVLLQSIPGEDENSSLQASWSLSEHLCGDKNQLRQALGDSLQRNYTSLRQSTRCQALALVGDGELEGRLRLALWLPERSEDVLDAVHNKLVTLLKNVIEQGIAGNLAQEDSIKATPEDTSSTAKDASSIANEPAPADKEEEVDEQSTWKWDDATWQWQEVRSKLADQPNWEWKEEHAQPSEQSSWQEPKETTEESNWQETTEQSNWWHENQQNQWQDGQTADMETSQEESQSGVKRKREDDNEPKEEALAEDEEIDMRVEEDDPNKPCIFVQGFPEAWTKKEISSLFDNFGGAAIVTIFEDAMGKAARVELTEPSRMAWAAEQTDGTSHGDGCIVQCELLGVTEIVEDRGTSSKRATFIDELPMPERPDPKPSEKDREVFLHDVPKSLSVDADLQAWASEFGAVEDMYILKDEVSQKSKGKAYVRFKDHSSALDCVSRHASRELGNVRNMGAVWSESERALQRALCVYRSDVQRVFVDSVGHTFPSLVSRAKVKSLQMYTPTANVKARPPSHVTSAAGKKRMHFCTDCTLDELEDVRAALGNVLEPFHKQVADRLKKLQKPLAKPKEPPPEPAPPAEAPKPVAEAPAMQVEADPLASFYEEGAIQSEGDAVSEDGVKQPEGDPLTTFYEERGSPAQPAQPEEGGDPLASFYEESKLSDVPQLPQEIRDALQNAFEETEAFMAEAASMQEAGETEEAGNTYVQGIEHFLKAIKSINCQCSAKDLLKQEVFSQLKSAKMISMRLRKAGVSISSLFPPAARGTPVPKPKADLARRSRSRSRKRIVPAKASPKKVQGAPAAPPANKAGAIGARIAPQQKHAARPPNKPAAVAAKPPTVTPRQPGIAPKQPATTPPGISPRPPSAPPPSASEGGVKRSLAVPKKKALEAAATSVAKVIGMKPGLGRKVVPKSV